MSVLSMSSLIDLHDTNQYLSSKEWLNTTKKNQLRDFLERGFPTSHEEDWKYADTRTLLPSTLRWSERKEPHNIHVFSEVPTIRLVFVNGHFSPKDSDLSLLPETIYLSSLSKTLETQPDLLKYLIQEFDVKQFPFAALNTALLTDGMVLIIPKNTELSTPIHCVYFNTHQDHFIISPRNIFQMHENSRAIFLEEYIGASSNHYVTNTLTYVYAKPESELHYYKIQNETPTATHMGQLFLCQEKNSVFKSFHLNVGASFVRENIRIALQDKGASCCLNGFYKLAHDHQQMDHHIGVNHIATESESSMLFKGVIDKKNRASFSGKVLVHKDAQKINAQQANHNLLLSPKAEVNTKPQLEIYADDVKCTHGATVGQIDPESLFYLQARGIGKNEARALLTHAFATDVFNKIAHSEIRHYAESIGNPYAD